MIPTEVRHYIEGLRDQVAAAIADGQSLDEMQRTIDMSVYSDWISYDALRLRNIEGMYNMLATNGQQQ